MKITVFTPTYNRAYIVENLYRSLCRQTCKDFEWLVVDDGSTDDTETLFSQWMGEDNGFPIRYYKKENGGKHRAINDALNLAKGELFFIVDSDDTLPPNAIELTLRQIACIPKNGTVNYAGVCNLKAYSADKPVGSSFAGDYLDCTSLEREMHGISGDKAEVVFTDIMRSYPFPEFDGEKFVTEAVVWDRIAADGYNFRFYNEITYLCEYREDGLTKQGMDLYFRNPQGYGLYLRQCRKLGKFSAPLQTYYDVQCFLAWRKKMELSQIAQLLGIKKSEILKKTFCYQARQAGSKIKHKLLSSIRRNT